MYLKDYVFIFDFVRAIECLDENLNNKLREFVVLIAEKTDNGSKKTHIQFIFHHLTIESCVVQDLLLKLAILYIFIILPLIGPFSEKVEFTLQKICNQRN